MISQIIRATGIYLYKGRRGAEKIPLIQFNRSDDRHDDNILMFIYNIQSHHHHHYVVVIYTIH